MFIARSGERLSLSSGQKRMLYSTGSLRITGFRERPVQNTFFEQDKETGHIAVVFPGYGYRCFGPVIYYPTLVLLSLGADVLWVEYAYDREPGYQDLPSAERIEWLASDTSAATDVALEQRPYQRVTLVGKSLGTVAMGNLLVGDSRLRSAEAIWLTPLLRNPDLRVQLEQLANPSLFVSGSADSQYDAAFAARIRKNPASRFLLLEGADHGLEVRDDALRSLQILRRITEATLEFLKG